MPAPQRAQEVELEMMQSWDSSNPTLGSNLEGWLNYHTGDNRWYYWDGTNWIKLALDTNNVVTDANLRDSAALSVIGRSANSTGDPADIATTANSNHVLRETSVLGVRTLTFDQVGKACMATDSVGTTQIENDAVTLDKEAHASTGGPSVHCYDKDGVPEAKQVVNSPAYLLGKDLTSSLSWPKISGTSFPASPVDGQIFTHTTHRCMYYYDATAAGWLSTGVYEIDAGDTADTTTGTYLRMYAGSLTAARYSSTIGWRFGFGVKVVGMYVIPANAQANSCTVEVMDDGAAVTNGSLSLAASDTQKQDEAMMSSTIASQSVIGVRVSGTGPLEGPSAVRVRFRRFET